jgi:hypothetical protein
MPTAGGEGRGYGFDSDTLLTYPFTGKIYVVAANDWAAVSGAFWEYDIATNIWNTDLPLLPTPRADLAGTFIPLCTDNPFDGLPGIWTFGGRVNDSCDPPLGPVEYYPLACTDCNVLTAVEITGTARVLVGETAVYTASITPPDAAAPVSLTWDNGDTAEVTSYVWDTPGTYTVEITGTNCSGTYFVHDAIQVEVYTPCIPLTGAQINGPASLKVGEVGTYEVLLTPADATPPISILWSSGATEPVTTYSWSAAGSYPVTVAAQNDCSTVEAIPLLVEVTSYWVWLPLVFGPPSP